MYGKIRNLIGEHIARFITLESNQKLAILCGFCLGALACSQPKIEVDLPAMWGQLEAGSYPVGFESRFLYDQTRSAIPYSDWDGHLYPTVETEGRQMQLNIWYPAHLTQKDQRLSFSHYLDLLGRQTDFGEMDAEKRAFAAQEFIKKTNALGGNGDFTTDDLDSLKDLNTYAFLRAKPIEDKFPLLVFPNGGSPAFQSIMCEYLASYGFVVAAMALKGQHAFTDEASVRGVEMAAIDLEFALRNLLDLAQVNREKIGMVGNAINSSQIIAFQASHAELDCMISLEGGLLSSFEQNILNKTPFYNAEAVDIPILAIYAPHPAIDPSYIFPLKYSTRYFLHFPQMTEFHFLNYGPFEQFVPGIIGANKGDVQKGYELACLYSRRFMEAFLKEDQTSLNILEKGPDPEVKAHVDTFFIREAIPKPPTITLVKDAFSKAGFSYLDSLYQAHKAYDEAPFSKTFYTELRDWLAWQKDLDYENRYQLYQLAYDSYPNSAGVNYYLAYFASQTKRMDISRVHTQKALKVLDQDPDLTLERKVKMRANLLAF